MIKNCFNYVGSKDRIFSIIDKNLDKSKSKLVDLFCGSGVVGVNEALDFEKILLNDACWQMVDTLKFFRNNKYDLIMDGIENVISKFKLSKENKEGYLLLREFYNEACSSRKDFNPIVFYCLVMHSFNYNIHINSSGGFSVPFGANRSNFNSSLRAKFKAFQDFLSSHKSKIFIENKSFETIVDKTIKTGDVKDTTFYCDPPYLSSDSAYGRIHYLGKWDAVKEKALYNTLDKINEAGGTFLLSNVIENNGETNKTLTEWAKGYKMIDVSTDYTNCNYQRKNKGKTREVLIRNY